MANHALLVGVSQYWDVVNFSQLSCCGKDVLRFYKKVIDPKLMNFDLMCVTMLYDDSKEDYYKPIESQIRFVLRQMIEETIPEDMFLFYFSGHDLIGDLIGDSSLFFL